MNREPCGVDGCTRTFLVGGLVRHRTVAHPQWVARQHALPARDPRKHPIGKPATNLRTADLPPTDAPITLIEDPGLPSCTVCHTPMHRHWRSAACSATGCYIMKRSKKLPDYCNWCVWLGAMERYERRIGRREAA